MSTFSDRQPVSPFVGDSEMAQGMRALDWSGTPIGPVEGWPQSLRTAVGIMLESRHPMLIWWGPEFTMFYNDAFVPLAGAKHPVGLGSRGWEMFAEIWPTIGPMLAGVLSTGVATWVDDQLLVMNRRGLAEETYWTYSYSPIRDEQGQVCGVFTATNDTTDRVLGERRLRTLRELGEVSAVTASSVERACTVALEALSGNRADLPFALIYLLAEDGRGARLVGGYGVVSGAAGSAIAPPAVPQADGEHVVWHVASTERPAVASGLSRRYPGALLPGVVGVGDGQPDTAVVLPLAAAGLDRSAGVLMAGISPFQVLDADYRGFCDLVAGQVAAAVADAHAYEAQRRRAEALAELHRAKTEFFANVSHEFRTPLTLIMGPVAELRASPAYEADARLRAELEVIYRNGLRLGKLVNTLLDFSGIQAGRAQARYQGLDLGVFTAELAGVFRSAIERAGLRFEVSWSDLGEPVYVDREMWEKVVLNLLSNAVKFTFEGRITVAVRRCGDAAVLTVADTGTGVPAEELPRLFDRFHRVRGARSRSNEGSGIGLALVAQLIALHGGTVTADSTPQVSTTFTVTLPLGSAHLPADQIVPASPGLAPTGAAAPFVAEALRWLPQADEAPDGRALAGSAAVESPGAALGGRVLVADDNADMREYLQRLLGARYDVQTVADGVATLAAATAAPPDLIVSDVMMPGMDGLELLAALRADPRTMRLPVLLLSARAGQDAVLHGLAAGADDYLVKPFSAQELLARVDAHLQLGRVRREAEQRLELLQQATAALSAAATPAAVAQTVITHLAHLLNAPATTFYELRETGTLESVAARGFAPEVERNWSTLPLSSPIAFADAARRRCPVWLESLADCEPAYPGLATLVAQYGYSAQADLPVVIGERCLGVLGALFDRPRQFSQAERAAAVALAELCAQALHRAQLLTAETAARQAAERFNRLVGRLSGATRVADVAQVVLDCAADLGAAAAVVVWRGTDDQLTVLAARGYPEPDARLAIDTAHPLAHAVRTARPVWRGSRSTEAWQDNAFDPDAALPVEVAVPLVVGDTAIGALGLRFADPTPVFAPEERAMILTLSGQCGQALDRARLYQAEHHVAQTLQRGLLPGQLPEFDRLALAARYLPGAPDMAAGGDWYDVVALDGQRVAIVVGDVVGHGATAAAVMGRLRTALAAYLLDGHGPAAALERLDRHAKRRIPGALASTAAVVVLDRVTGQVCWARAGHPPPLLIEPERTRYLTGGAGGPLGVHRRPPYTEATTRIEPGACLLLYTDGLIERRGQVLDEGLDHLAATAAELCSQPPTALLDGLLARALPDTGPADDIALIAAHYLPAPLYQRLPADPAQLPGLRRAVRAWTRAGALPAALGEDLQITLGEAAANAVEHAYAIAGEPGEFTYLLTRRGDGAVEVEVRDFGRWRPDSPGNRHRGRGLVIMGEIATDVALDASPGGTQVRFRLPAPPPDPPPPAPTRQAHRDAAPPVPAELHVHPEPDGGRRLELRGDLDLTAATTLRGPLLDQIHRPGPVILDLRALDYLSSAGVGLLIDAAQHADEHHIPMQSQLPPHGLVARLLTLTGVENILPVGTDATEQLAPEH